GGGGTYNVDSIGGYYGGREFGGDYAEVIVYNRVLTQSEQNRVGWYLTQKYGLTTIYTQPAGQSYVWVQVPEFMANGYIWAYWGGLDTNPPACTMNGSTWDAGYKGVWHMNQRNARDSTANANHGAPSSVYVLDAPGAIGGAQMFNGNSQITMLVNSNSSLDIYGNKMTQSAWIAPAGNVAEATIATRNGAYYFQRHSDQKVRAYHYGTTPEGYLVSTGTAPLYAWSHVAYSYDGANIKFYINGAEAGTNITKTGNIRSNGSYFQIGGENGARLWNGLLDEVRVSDVPRSSNWMWACYMNQASNAAFVSPSFFISNEGATNVAAGSADLLGYLHEDDDIETYVWVYYGLTDGGSVVTNWQFTNYFGALTEGLIMHTAGSLQADKTYYYRYYASNAVRFAWAAPSAQFFTGEVTIYANDTSASEIGPGTGMFTVYRLTSFTNEALIVNYVMSGTAVNGVDYETLGGSVVIPAGETNAIFTVTPIEDVLIEGSETVNAILTFGSYAIGAPSNAVVTIHDAAGSEWPYRMKIMFPGFTSIDGEILTNFPVSVKFGANIPAFSYSTFALPESGGDLRFGNSSETKMLNYEIEKWDSSSNSYVWVQVPELVSTNTFIWAYWGNKSITNAPVYTTNGSTWSEGFAGVWHLKENAFPFADSSANRFNGTVGNVPTQIVNGIIGNGQSFNGLNQSIQVPYQAALNTTQFTVSCWVKENTFVTNIWQTPLFTRDGTRGYNFYAGSNGLWQAWVGNNIGGFNSIPAGPIIDGEWIYLTMNFNNEFTQKFYTNGVFINSASVPTFAVNTVDALKMGVGANYLNGEMDEVRVENVPRSSNWVWNCWMNQASNDVFNAYGNIRKFVRGTVITVR
ncbi:MAG: DUF2341 domain-containing protein, partial [Kiritimatiellae bacterium]|nr:DUF2341 domain-containing protein [Kiritimatiellia bacterium]